MSIEAQYLSEFIGISIESEYFTFLETCQEPFFAKYSEIFFTLIIFLIISIFKAVYFWRIQKWKIMIISVSVRI